MTGSAAVGIAVAFGLLGASAPVPREGVVPGGAAAAAASTVARTAARPDPSAVARPVADQALDRSAGVGVEVGVGRWQWPVAPRPRVLRPFVAPVSRYAAGHRGIDVTASEGTAVLAVEGGVVTHAGVVAGRGTVSVEHADGLRSTYEPVTASVARGQVVATGERLGVVGPAAASHCGPVGCLHLGARRGEHYLDPLPLLAGGRVILLPLR